MISSEAKLSIIVPCYNEADNIPLIVARFKEVLNNDDAIEVILVNNGSQDHSDIVFQKELEKHQDTRFKMIKVPVNQGYGYGILSGLKEAKGSILSWTHADMQTDPKDVILAFELYKKKNNDHLFIKGKRENRQLSEAFFTWSMQMISSMVLQTSLSDINAQPKMFSRNFYEQYLYKDAPYDFSLDLYALYWAKKKADIMEIPVYFNKRIHGEAKGGGSFKTRIKLIKRTLQYIFQLNRKMKTQ